MHNVAVVGGGIAGLVSALGLARRGRRVTLLEAGRGLGGHTNTYVVPDGPDAGVGVDTGFITFNDNTYPRFIAWLAELGLEGRESDMSFGYQCRRTGLSYGGHSLNTFFAQRRNLINPDFLRLALEIARFNRFARRWVASPQAPALGSLGDLARRFPGSLLRHYLIPLGAAIWSAPPQGMLDFPASMYVRFFHNHGLLSVFRRPIWRTVPGGSHRYLAEFQRVFSGTVETNSPVEAVRRSEGSVEVRSRGEWRSFDRVVLACHADQALKLLVDPTPNERRLLSPWCYQPNLAVLHRDPGVLPANPRARASWNYVREPEGNGLATLTYDMNRLQGLKTRHRYLVTLNPTRPIGQEHIVGQWTYHHPQYTLASLATQPELGQLQGVARTYFCGSYFRYGFHEDAVVSAEDVLRAFPAV